MNPNDIEVEINQNVFLPIYRPLQRDEDFNIDFLYGSRDSGKSRDTAQRKVKKCMEADYFRCILGRKTFNTIKDSQWQTIKDVVEDWGLESLFTFTTNPLEIKCVNGNKFLARGFDDPGKIKSLQNPSDAWIEEGSQLTYDDWVILITSLRSNKGKIKIDVTFNPETEGRFEEFWLYKEYFAGHDALSFTNQKIIKVRKPVKDKIKGFIYKDVETVINYRVTHSTYFDNPHASDSRIAFYEDLKITSPYHYRIYGLGEWGNRENKAPFVLTFSRQKHLGKTEFNPNMPLYLSFDFNRNPMCCSVIQWDGEKKIDWIEVIKLPNSSIWSVCDLIKIKYPDALYIICGDYSGIAQSGLVKDQDLNNYYKIIRSELGCSDGQMKHCVNPKQKDNQVLVNYCFAHLDIAINPDTCQPLIFDIEFVEIRADGTLRKNDRDDPAQQADVLDTARYFLNRNFAHLNPLQYKYNEVPEDVPLFNTRFQ